MERFRLKLRLGWSLREVVVLIVVVMVVQAGGHHLSFSKCTCVRCVEQQWHQYRTRRLLPLQLSRAKANGQPTATGAADERVSLEGPSEAMRSMESVGSDGEIRSTVQALRVA